MPFTPIHMGPGMLVKAAVPKYFSIVVYGLVQIALDVEALWFLLRRDYPFHRFMHTYAGATIVAASLAVIGKPLSQYIKAIWNLIALRCPEKNLSVEIRTTWTATITASVVGAYGHILIDSLFHGDIEPFQPWSPHNVLRGMISPTSVEIACIIAGVIGLIWYFSMIARKRPSAS